MVSIVLLGAPASGASPQGFSFQAKPGPDSSTSEKGYFRFDAEPGDSVAQELELVNTTDKDISLRVAPVDGAASAYGGTAYSDSEKKPAQVGAWIRLTQLEFAVPAGGSVIVPFSVRVPGDASSGLHVGGLAVWDPAAATTSGDGEKAGGASMSVTMVTRLVLPLVVTTPGPREPHLTVTGVKPSVRFDGIYLLVGIASDGTDEAGGEGILTLPADGFSSGMKVGDMVPASSTSYPIKWKTDPVEGTYDVEVSLRYAGGTKTATWSGPVVVASKETEALEEQRVDDRSAAVPTIGASWLIYGVIGALVVIVLIMGVLLLKRRRPAPKA